MLTPKLATKLPRLPRLSQVPRLPRLADARKWAGVRWLGRRGGVRWLPGRIGIWLALLLAIGVVHIVATFVIASEIDRVEPTERLAGITGVNQMVVLPPVTRETQPLPFMMPEARYAACLFDASEGPIDLTVDLPEAGWILSLHDPSGANFYFAPGTDDRQLTLQAVLLPPGDRFVGMLPGALEPGRVIPEIRLPAARGIALVRAPLKGRAYAAEVVATLARARCRPLQGLGTAAR